MLVLLVVGKGIPFPDGHRQEAVLVLLVGGLQLNEG